MKTTGICTTGKQCRGRGDGVRGTVNGVTLVCLLLAAGSGSAQNLGFSVIVKGNLTTSAQIFDNPTSSDPLLRSNSFSVEDFWGAEGELRYRFPESSVAVGVSAGYIRAPLSRTRTVAFIRSVPIEDGFTAIPLELTGYFIIPASGPRFGVYMGGGVGMYIGRRMYSLAGAQAPDVERKPGYGIHVLGGISFRFVDRFSVLAEMKFRDLQFESTNAHSVVEVKYEGAVIKLPTQPFVSRISTDGILFQLGIAFHI